ncbi:MAG: TonB-dependent receptor [Candidatus Aminicenantes bacterium]|nr:TonB-dependent receptor [Candidatus Aminicenantes bacterium]
MTKGTVKKALWFSLVFLVFSSFTHLAAQQTLAVLEGYILMEDESPIPGVAVTAQNTETGVAFTSVTNSKGKFVISGISPGSYDLTAFLQGFDQVTQKGITLSIGSRKSIDFKLKPSTLQENIVVTAVVPTVELKKTSISGLVDRQQIESLPLLNRDFNALTFTKPGVSEDAFGDPRSNATPQGYGETLIDGVSNEELVNNVGRSNIPADAIQEFAVITNQFAAEFGNASSMVRTAITRSGTNEFKGRAAYFYRDEMLDTPNYFVNHESYEGPKITDFEKSPYKYNNISGTFGGPIIKDKAHFFIAYDGLFQTTYNTVTSPLVPRETVPQPFTGHQLLVKLDYQSNLDNNFSLRFLYNPNRTDDMYVGGIWDKTTGTTWDIKPMDIQLNWTLTPTKNSINEMRLLYSTRNQDFYSTNYPDTYNIYRPSLVTGKYSWYPQWTHEKRYQFIDTYTIYTDKHTFKMGLDVASIPMDAHVPAFSPGEFDFSTDAPFNAQDPSTYPDLFLVNVGPSDFPLANIAAALFVQDSWEISKRLTLNYGLRFNYFKTEGYDIKAFDIRHINPRIAFGWDPIGDGKTSIRGGWGTFSSNAMSNAGFNGYVLDLFKFDIVIFPNYPDPFADNPFWALMGVTRADMTISSAGPLRDRYFSKENVVAPYTSQLTLGFQREIFTGWSASLDAVWTKGYHLMRNENLNATIPGTYNPMTGARQRYADNSIGNQFYESDNGHSDYKAILVNLGKKYSQGWSLEASYTLSWSKADVERENTGKSDNADFNWTREYGYTNSDARHRIILNGIVDLPLKFQLSGIFFYHSAYPWTAVYGYDQNLDSNRSDYYDQVRNSNRGFDSMQLNLRLSKFFKIDRFSLQLFAEAYNVFNRANFTSIFNVHGLPLFGKPIQAADPRLLQLGVRFDF